MLATPLVAFPTIGSGAAGAIFGSPFWTPHTLAAAAFEIVLLGVALTALLLLTRRPSRNRPPEKPPGTLQTSEVVHDEAPRRAA